MALIQDAMSASMPGTAKQFLGSVQARPIGQMVMYVAMIALLPLVGYILGWIIGPWGVAGIQWGIIYGIVMYLGIIVAVIGAGFAVGALSNGILGRQVSTDEAITIVGYAATPGIAIGFLSGIFAWIWGLGILGMILGFLGWVYSAYLLYEGGGARYGADKAIALVIVALVAEIVISFIFSAIAGSIVWSAMWGSVMSGLGRYGGYAGGYTGGGYYGL